MSHQYKINPITGKMDMTGLSDDEIASIQQSEVADFEPNVTTVKWTQGKTTTGKTAMQILKSLLVQDVAPKVTLASNQTATMREEGTIIYPTFTATPTQGTYTIASMTLTIKNSANTVVYTETINAPTSGEATTFAFDGAIAENSTVQISIVDTQGMSANSNTLKYTFGNYMFIGFGEKKELAEITEEWLSANMGTKTLKTSYATAKATYNIPIDNITGEPKPSYFYIAVPTAWLLTEDRIFDANINAYGFMTCLGDITDYVNGSLANVSYRIFISNKQQEDNIACYIQ